MSNTFSLDDLRAAADAKYASLNVPIGDGQTAVLVNALQLTKEKRSQLVEIQNLLDEPEADQTVVLQDALRVAGSTTPEATERLIEAVGDNLAYLIELFSRYSRSTQVGEA